MAANRRFSRASKSRRTPAAFPISHETQNRALKCRYITRLSIRRAVIPDGFLRAHSPVPVGVAVHNSVTHVGRFIELLLSRFRVQDAWMPFVSAKINCRRRSHPCLATK